MTLDILVDKLFDYAGMFPPAALGFDAAMQESAGFPEALGRPGMLQNDIVLTPENWRYVTDDAFAKAGFTRPCHICLVGVSLEGAADVLRDVGTFNATGGTESPPRLVTTIEAHFEAGLALDGVAGQITVLRHLAGDGRVDIYIEPKWDDAAWNDGMGNLMAMFDALNSDIELPPVGLKFRAWGPTALAPETVAKLLPMVDERAIPLKATQGLHHPLVTGHEQNTMGFVGLVAALRLCDAADMSDEERVALLTESDASAFNFDSGLEWRGHSATLAETGSERVPFSIGTCSLAEPDAELTALFD